MSWFGRPVYASEETIVLGGGIRHRFAPEADITGQA